jgi:hypothetical protein
VPTTATVAATTTATTTPIPDRTRPGGGRRLALLVVGVAIVSALGGVWVGSRLRSPAEAEADRKPPTASRITVPVTRQALSSTLALSGEIQFAEPFPVRLAGSVGLGDGDTAVLTRLPELDAPLAEGDVVMEVSGRPVFVFQGALPTYRSFEPGVTGPDVQQLEEALVRLGLDPGPVDTVYDDATEAALDQLYALKGYQSEGPTSEQRTQLRAAEKAVTDAEASLTRATTELANAGKPLSGAELLRQQQALQSAKDAVPAAEATATRRNADATATVTSATSTRDAAKAARDAAKAARDAARAPGAINPATGSPYTAEEWRLLDDDLAAKETALTQAEHDLRRAISDRDATAVEVAAAIDAANDALLLAQATYDEAVAPKDTSAASDAVMTAQQVLDQARADLMIQEVAGRHEDARRRDGVPAHAADHDHRGRRRPGQGPGGSRRHGVEHPLADQRPHQRRRREPRPRRHPGVDRAARRGHRHHRGRHRHP